MLDAISQLNEVPEQLHNLGLSNGKPIRAYGSHALLSFTYNLNALDSLQPVLGGYKEIFLGASQIFFEGETFIDVFKKDEYAEERLVLPYYPFKSKEEWKLAKFMETSGLSMAQNQEFLELPLVLFFHQ